MLYIMRHGKTEWNAKYKLQGRTDISLNEDGRKMAKNAWEGYRDIHFDICYKISIRIGKLIDEEFGTSITKNKILLLTMYMKQCQV